MAVNTFYNNLIFTQFSPMNLKRANRKTQNASKNKIMPLVSNTAITVDLLASTK